MTRIASVTALLALQMVALSPRQVEGQTGTPTHVQVTAASAHVRSGPGTNHPVVATAIRGTVIAILGREGDWLLVELPLGLDQSAKTGYLHTATGRLLSASQQPDVNQPQPRPLPPPTPVPSPPFPEQARTPFKSPVVPGRPITLSFGYGNSFGGLGINLGTNIADRVTLHAGGGYFPLSKLYEAPSGGFEAGPRDMLMVAGGARVFLEDTRVRGGTFLDLQVGMLGGEYNETNLYQGGTLVSHRAEQKALFGPSVLIGREVFWGSGAVGVRIAGGGSYNMTEIDWKDVRFLWALDIGMAFRL